MGKVFVKFDGLSIFFLDNLIKGNGKFRENGSL
jgi:hypothetical protein